MSRLLIDGYNLLHQAARMEPFEDKEVEDLLESLRRYKRFKGHKITIVFDGHERGRPVEGKTRIKGISVVYSKLGEKADQLIERSVRKSAGSVIVVTSDRELAHSVEKEGAVVVSSSEFMERLSAAEYLQLKGGEEEEELSKPPLDTRKKGNPKRKSKQERARQRRLKKL